MDKIRPLLSKALEQIQTQNIPPGIALDFGIGGGDETAHLLKQGYQVIAIDNFKEFLTEVKLRKDLAPYLSQLTTIHANFEDVDWKAIPQVDLFVALFSLNFVQPDKFYEVWKNIVAHVKPGGYFVGQLYTHLLENIQRDGYFVSESTELIPFLSEEELRGLLNEFDVEYFEDVNALYKNESEAIHLDGKVYSVIARKKTIKACELTYKELAIDEISLLLIKALEQIKAQNILPGVAIDFGMGLGGETAHLLKLGYEVIAIDKFKEWFTELKQLDELEPYLPKLTTIHAQFEELDWKAIPQVDLFMALNSLNFIPPDQFYKVWENIVAHIKPGGYFVGQLYTHLLENIQQDEYIESEGRRYVPFLSKEGLKGLLKEFDVKYFEDVEALYNMVEEQSQREGKNYSVIARKKK